MADRGDLQCLLGVGELVDDAVSADAQRAQSPQSAAKRPPSEGLALEQTEGVLYGVDERPAQFQ